MASSKEYLNFILEQLAELEEISYRAMMGQKKCCWLMMLTTRNFWQDYFMLCMTNFRHKRTRNSINFRFSAKERDGNSELNK